jgi:hypothetical protein
MKVSSEERSRDERKFIQRGELVENDYELRASGLERFFKARGLCCNNLTTIASREPHKCVGVLKQVPRFLFNEANFLGSTSNLGTRPRRASLSSKVRHVWSDRPRPFTIT